MPDINSMAPGSGRRLRENNTVVNTAEMIEALYNALVVNKNAGVQLTGSILQEEKTQANATAGVVTFSSNISTIEILNTDTVNTGIFTVNGITITVPPAGSWKDGVGGTPGATVSITGATTYILHRFS